ncbi:MAG: hypothetical protein LBE91_18200 [Tannerella sp.]|jgi:hypothetical protein|nr:hypothetical protein [Tannerella sp.]
MKRIRLSLLILSRCMAGAMSVPVRARTALELPTTAKENKRININMQKI